MGAPFIVTGSNAAALFTLKVYRGESMVLLAMNWKDGEAAGGLRRVRDPVQGAGRRQVLFVEESPGVHRRRQCQSDHALNDVVPDPEVPLGAFSAERRTSRVLRLSRQPCLHERAG